MIYCIKCFLKSNEDTKYVLLLSIDVLIYSTRSINAWEEDIDDQKPYWLFERTLLLYINCSSLLLCNTYFWELTQQSYWPILNYLWILLLSQFLILEYFWQSHNNQMCHSQFVQTGLGSNTYLYLNSEILRICIWELKITKGHVFVFDLYLKSIFKYNQIYIQNTNKK